MGFLRQFMAANTSLAEVLHVQFYPGGGFLLWDSSGICLCDRRTAADEAADRELLLDTAAAVSPRRMIVHVGPTFLPHPTVKALKDLFRTRLQFSTACPPEKMPRTRPENSP